MSLKDNSPSMSYIAASGISVVWNEEIYMVADFHSCKKYIYWNVELPNQFNASNVMPNRSDKQFLVLINDNGVAQEVPNEGIEVYYDGNSIQNIRDRIFGIYDNNDATGDRFVTIEQDINGIKTSVGKVEQDNLKLHEEVSRIDQKADSIDLTVKDIVKEYNDNKETNQLREDLNSAIIKLNSALGVFKSEFTDYSKDNQINNEEKIKIETQIEIMNNSKTVVMGYVDKVIAIAIANGVNEDKIALESSKSALELSHTNLVNVMTNAIGDGIITPTERTILIDAFAKYSQKLMSLKNTCDDVVLLGMGGVIVEELASISLKSDEIKLYVSKVESTFKSESSVAKIEAEKQIDDNLAALDYLKSTVDESVKDGEVDDTEKSTIEEKIPPLLKEKEDVDNLFKQHSEDKYISDSVKEKLVSMYSIYTNKHDDLISKIRSIVEDGFVNDVEKIQLDTAFKECLNAIENMKIMLKEAIDNINFNKSNIELQNAKDYLQGQIDNVNDSIEGIDKVLDGTFENNIIDEVERKNIQQSLDILKKEKLDIDAQYEELYNNSFLDGDLKVEYKDSYDTYSDRFNDVVKLMQDILDKESYVNDTDKTNLKNYSDALNLAISIFVTISNRVIDYISKKGIESAKDDMQTEIKDVNDRLEGMIGDIGDIVGDGIIEEAEAKIIQEHLRQLDKEKLDIDSKYEELYNNSFLD